MSPLFGLGDELDRHVSGVGFGFALPGEVIPEMFLASGAAAVGIAASTADGDEAGSQNWAFGLELFLAGLKGAADESGVLGDFHRLGRVVLRGFLPE